MTMNTVQVSSRHSYSRLIAGTLASFTVLALAPINPAVAAPSPLQSSSPQSRQRQSRPESVSPRSLALNEAGVEAAKEKRYAQASGHFKEALKADPYNLTAAFNLAGMYVLNKQEQEAIKLLESYRKKGVEDAGLYARLGDSYFSTEKVNLAIENYSNALALDPTYEHLYAKLGAAYSLTNRLKEAEEAFSKAERLSTVDATTLGNYASILLANKKPQKAIEISKRAIQHTPRPELYVTLGNAYESTRSLPNALIAFKTAQDLGAKDKALTKKIGWLEKELATE